MKRLLEFNLNMTKPVNRLVRRALIIGILTVVAIGVTGYAEINPVITPFVAGILALIDKAIRMQKE